VTSVPVPQRSTAELQAFYDARVTAQDERAPGYGAKWGQLTTCILAYGGRAVVPPLALESDITELLAGTCVERSVRLRKGRPNQCHQTTAAAWDEGKLDAIVTGYALSEDGLWRQHSWGLARGVVIEPTEKRTAYFGIELRGSRADEFASEQLNW
jgi:hypothetical protein